MENVDKDIADMLRNLKKLDKLTESVAPVLAKRVVEKEEKDEHCPECDHPMDHCTCDDEKVEEAKHDGHKPEWLIKAEKKAEEREGKKVDEYNGSGSAVHEHNGSESNVYEKWSGDHELNPKKKGMFKGKSKGELEAELAKLHKSGPHKKGSAEYTKQQELNFAIRAKSGWKEEAEVDNSKVVEEADSDVIAWMKRFANLGRL